MYGAAIGRHLHLCGGTTHAVGTAEEAVEGVRDVFGEDGVEGGTGEALLSAGVKEFGKGAVGDDDAAVGGKRNDTVGDGFDDGFELSSTRLESGVGLGKLGGRLLGERARRLEISGHGVETGCELTQFLRGGLGNAAGVVSGGDGFHGIGEGLDGASDLFGKIERQPAAGEQREAGGKQKEKHVEIADLAALAEERPVSVRTCSQAKGCG